MRFIGCLVCGIFLSAGLGLAKPRISERGVRGAGSAAGGKIARGSAFHVWGMGLGPVEAVHGEAPFGTELGGVTVAFTQGETAIQAFVTEAGAERVSGILPSSTAAGDYEVTVTFGGETSESFKVQVADRNLGLVTIEAVTGGFAAGRIRPADADPVAIGLITPVRPGQQIELDAAGLGPIETPDNDLPPEANVIEGAVLVLNGAIEAPVSYLGRNPHRPGYDLVRAALPAEGLPLGCGVSLVLKFGDARTGRVSLPAAEAEARACQNALDLPFEILERLQNGGTITTGSAHLIQQSVDLGIAGPALPGLPPLPGAMKTEMFSAAFSQYTLGSFSSLVADETAQRDGCFVIEGSDSTFQVDASPLDAGAELLLTGPNNLSVTVKRDPKGEGYFAELTSPASGGFPLMPGPGDPDKIVRGEYKLTGAGGANVGPFEAAVTVPGAITWTNKDEIGEVDRAAELKFTWTGGEASHRMHAIGFAGGTATEGKLGFYCSAPGDAGGITVPAEILGRLPPAEGDDIEKLGMLTLQYTSGAGTGKFKAPLTAGGEIDFGFFVWSIGAAKPGVAFK
jgi:uncharacterized protein (TIGR03437 family)